jgi:hypothetical protein
MADPVYTWIFVREAERLTIERLTPLRVAVSSPTGERRIHEFDTPVTLLEFQLGLQSDLVDTGWSLDSFHPERRARLEAAPAFVEAADRRVLAAPGHPRSRQ